MYHSPYDIAIYLKILVYEEIAHIADAAPWNFRVCGLELISQHSGGFADNLYVFDDAVIAQYVLLLLIF